MDENELRIAGLEKAFIAIAAEITDERLLNAIDTLKGELREPHQSEDEKKATQYAISLIEDGRRRWVFGQGGGVIPGRE